MSAAVCLADVADEVGVPAVVQRIRMCAAAGEYVRAAAVRMELNDWMLSVLGELSDPRQSRSNVSATPVRRVAGKAERPATTGW